MRSVALAFLKFVKHWPTEVLVGFGSALITASVALLAGLLTMWGAGRRQSRQLAHEAAERQREHERQIRREVLLQAATAVAAYTQNLAYFARLDINVLDSANILKDHMGAFERLVMVAAKETLQKMLTLAACLYEATGELALRKTLVLGCKVAPTKSNVSSRRFRSRIGRRNASRKSNVSGVERATRGASISIGSQSCLLTSSG
jgi:hypothetical protein